MTETIAGLWAAVRDRPGDDGLKLVLADACAEAGDGVTERALRWCVAKKKWPNDRGDQEIAKATMDAGRYGWFGQPVPGHTSGTLERHPNSVLSHTVWAWFLRERVRGRGRTPRHFKNLRPLPWCRDDRIDVIIYRLGLALAWADKERPCPKDAPSLPGTA
jgi:hypothetical protein